MAVQRTLPAKQITLNMALAVDSISFDAVRVALNLVANMQRLEMTARFFIQRLELSGISEQRRQPVSKIDYQKLREIAEKTKIAGEAPVMPFDQRINALNDFMKHFSPDIALALLDERERNQQYIKSRDQENEEIALTVGKLRVELEAADNNLIDSECHVAELEEALRDKQALLEASEKRIAELEAREIKPAKGEVLVVVSGFTGCGKSAIAGEIEIAMKAIGVPVKWTNGDAEKRMTGNSPVIPDGWISCSERMPEKNQNVLISVNFDSSLVEPLICSARYTGSTFRRGDATIKPGNGIEQATHWMPLPEPPQEVNRG